MNATARWPKRNDRPEADGEDVGSREQPLGLTCIGQCLGACTDDDGRRKQEAEPRRVRAADALVQQPFSNSQENRFDRQNERARLQNCRRSHRPFRSRRKPSPPRLRAVVAQRFPDGWHLRLQPRSEREKRTRRPFNTNLADLLKVAGRKPEAMAPFEPRRRAILGHRRARGDGTRGLEATKSRRRR